MVGVLGHAQHESLHTKLQQCLQKTAAVHAQGLQRLPRVCFACMLQIILLHHNNSIMPLVSLRADVMLCDVTRRCLLSACSRQLQPVLHLLAQTLPAGRQAGQLCHTEAYTHRKTT
jgi:hypothetical protein